MKDEGRGPALSIVCAWCGRTLFQGGPGVSHGICDGCLPKVMANAYESAGEPVIVDPRPLPGNGD